MKSTETYIIKSSICSINKEDYGEIKISFKREFLFALSFNNNNQNITKKRKKKFRSN
jgi:hypothetical protein